MRAAVSIQKIVECLLGNFGNANAVLLIDYLIIDNRNFLVSCRSCCHFFIKINVFLCQDTEVAIHDEFGRERFVTWS